ncbi:nuclear transport factor 2 family protein [Albibacillus kandeliae]|uniref:nuclear transport factor 2 family protein n=1 Tax=Albibacillus kandeliae TaxID=2174228 RepID=UPI000D689583|nr:nuclear transport factor 2 family protein [Albibacillus kandeliae]
MILPDPIQRYFSSRAPQDASTLAAAFAPDAEVRDEGQTLRGPQQILRWWQDAKAKYDHSAEPLELTEASGKILVLARVRGNFPGSPADLTFKFGLSGNRISTLEIE